MHQKQNCSQTSTNNRIKRRVSDDDVTVSVGPIRPSNNVMDIKVSGNIAKAKKDAHFKMQPKNNYKVQRNNKKLLFSGCFKILNS